MLGLLAASCQKEQMLNPQVTTVETDAVFQMGYTVDGVHYSVMLHGDDELDLLLRQLNALARQGHQVVITGNNALTSIVSTKEVLTFSTSNEEEIIAWEIARLKEGYSVTIEYNPRTGVFTGTAIR